MFAFTSFLAQVMFPKQYDRELEKDRLRGRLHGESQPGLEISARAEISSPVCETGLGFSARAEIQKNLM